VVIATDGFIDVEEEVFDLIRNNLGNTNVFAFGIGSSVNRHLIEGMARVGMGESFVVTSPAEAPAKAERFRSVVESPVLTGVTVKFDGFDAYDVEPPQVPDILQERPVIVFGKYRGKPRGKINASGISASGPWTETVNAESARPSADNTGLRYLWARHRIAILSDYNSLRPDDRRIGAVTELGLQYNLLTTYTSFVAIDTQTRGGDGKPVTVKQPLPLPEGVSDYAVGSPALARAYSPSDGIMMKAKAGPHSGVAYDVRERAIEGAPEIPVQTKVEKADGKAARPITLGDVLVSGGLAKDVVSRVVTGKMGSLERQYRGSGTGQLVISLVVLPDGTIKSVKILRGGADWQPRVTGEINKWRFPATADGREAKVTITLFAGA
jgi:Ca-activated chloride channel family protein